MEEKPQAERILVVEDDHRMQKVLTRIFTSEGYAVDTADNGRTALESFSARVPAAVLLDLMLPQVSGRQVCKEMKAATPDIPVIILSSIADVVDKVLLLEMGADDYVTKPFSPRELLARVQAAIRRQSRNTAATGKAVCRIGECTIHFDQMTATSKGQPLAMTALEFKLLKHFVSNAGIVLSRELLLKEVWGYNAYPTTRTVDNQILKLRHKLEADPANPIHLQTIYGAGYRFNP